MRHTFEMSNKDLFQLIVTLAKTFKGHLKHRSHLSVTHPENSVDDHINVERPLRLGFRSRQEELSNNPRRISDKHAFAPSY